MISRLLCKIGIHHIRPHCGGRVHVYYACNRCGKQFDRTKVKRKYRLGQ